MAIDSKEFTELVDTNLKANSKYTKFFLNFLKDGKRIRKVIDYSNKDWDKRTRVSKAKFELEALRDQADSRIGNFSENSTLNTVADIFFTTTVRYDSPWGKDLYGRYNLYCKNTIGNKKLKDIKKVHIDKLIQQMSTKGYSKQTQNGCSHATIKKVLIQALRPVLQYAVDNNVISKVPPFDIPKQKIKTKKTVSNASNKLATLFTTINELYKDDSFYRGLFLFALYGRRWNEIRTLCWSDIDLLNNKYTIRAENNKIAEDQTYELPYPIKDAILQIKDDNLGLVFKSPVTNKELYSPKKQLAHIKEKANIPELTMHYFRHILVSAMGEIGTASTILSASLGHTNLNTVNQFYLSANHTKGSAIANEMIGSIVNTKED